jgi:hypothetical protein
MLDTRFVTSRSGWIDSIEEQTVPIDKGTSGILQVETKLLKGSYAKGRSHDYGYASP